MSFIHHQDLSRYLHNKNIEFVSLANLDEEKLSWLSRTDANSFRLEKKLSQYFFDYYHQKYPNLSFALILNCKQQSFLLSTVHILHIEASLVGTENFPLDIKFYTFPPNYLCRVSEFVVAHIMSLASKGDKAFFSLAPFEERIIKPFKRYLSDDRTSLIPLAGRYLNLTNGYHAVRASYRKSLRPLINQISRNYEINTIASSSSSLNDINCSFQAYKNLHHRVSGRITRPASTWDIQRSLILDGTAYLISIYESTTLLGAAFFIQSKLTTFYFSGAYDRSCEGSGLSHALVDMSIQKSCRSKVPFFDFGFPQYCPYEPYSFKDKSLAHFRQAFSADLLIGANIWIYK